jgi:hypothetical protein
VKCEEPFYITKSSVEVTFKDSASNKYLYSETLPIYNKDSIEVYNPSGEKLFLLMSLRNNPITPTESYWSINFGTLFDYRTDSSSFNQEICKNFIVQYSYNERDTITTCFKSKNEECGSVFSSLKIYHRGKLLASQTNTTYALITVIKN